MHNSWERQEIIKRTFKYLIVALAVGFAANNIPAQENKLSLKEVTMIAITAACIFAIVDLYAPTVSNRTILTISKNKC